MSEQESIKPTYREWKSANLDRLVDLFHEKFGNKIDEAADFFEHQYAKEMEAMSEAKGIYPLHTSIEAARNVHPQKFVGQLVHVDEQNVYQLGPNDSKNQPTVIKHDRKIFDVALEGNEPVVGKCYEVTYARGQGKVNGELSQEDGLKLQARKTHKI